jgi:hypothetical protein
MRALMRIAVQRALPRDDGCISRRSRARPYTNLHRTPEHVCVHLAAAFGRVRRAAVRQQSCAQTNARTELRMASQAL